jgi:CDP-diacylglycerol--glycerol-3-phosphate 3-phosphatidyltransferase
MNNLKRIIPNLLSASRLVLIVPFVIVLANDNLEWLIVITAAIAITDFLDGYLARVWNVVSDAGKILDPLFDKICTAVAAVALVKFRGFPIGLLAAMVIRDIVILLAGLTLIRSRNIIPVSNLIGRITMGMMTICFAVYILNIKPLKLPVVYLTLLVMIASLVSYGLKFIRAIAHKAA